MALIRRGTTADIDDVVGLWEHAAGPTRLRSDASAVERLLARDADAVLVAEIDGRVVGTLVVGWDGWRCHLYRMAVAPTARRANVATELLRAASDHARALGARRLDAMVSDDNAGGIAFWKAAGFEVDQLDHRWALPLCD